MREPRQVIADWYGDDRLAEIGDAIIGALEAEGYRIVGEGQACIGGEVVTLLAAPVVCIAGGDGGQERITLRVPPGTWDRLGRPLGEDGTVSYIAEEAS